MARRQVIVQLDDDLTAALDELAEREGVSRSELLRKGAAAVLEAYRIREDERRHREGYERFPEDTAFVEAAMRHAARIADPW